MQLEVVEEVFLQRHEHFTDVTRVFQRTKVPILKTTHISTGLRVDISVRVLLCLSPMPRISEITGNFRECMFLFICDYCCLVQHVLKILLWFGLPVCLDYVALIWFIFFQILHRN